jgi:ribosome maturation factor RimP
MRADELFGWLESRVEALGFELVDLERAGDARRPILRLRIDRPDSTEESGVTLDDCVRVSRELEPYLDTEAALSPSYVLEVSSPGVERPLVRPRDWRRFAGREVVIKGRGTLAGRSSRLQGTLLGLAGEGDQEEQVELRLAEGDAVRFPLAEVKAANLVYRWEKKGRSA